LGDEKINEINSTTAKFSSKKKQKRFFPFSIFLNHISKQRTADNVNIICRIFWIREKG